MLYLHYISYAIYTALKPGRLMSAPAGDSAISKEHFLTSYV